jgi:hypothetical protein
MRDQEERKQGGHDYSILQESSRKKRKEALPLETAGLEKPPTL